MTASDELALQQHPAAQRLMLSPRTYNTLLQQAPSIWRVQKIVISNLNKSCQMDNLFVMDALDIRDANIRRP